MLNALTLSVLPSALQLLYSERFTARGFVLSLNNTNENMPLSET
jgi:hypothetical protein